MIRVPYTSCPLCDSSKIEDHMEGDCTTHPVIKKNPSFDRKIQWKKCLNCNHVFNSAYFSQEAFDVALKDVHDTQKAGFEFESQRHVSAEMIEKVLPYVSSGYWLDVGFGNGSLLFTAKEYGFDPLGLDLRKENVDLIKEFGITAFSVDIVDFNFYNKVSVVSMTDVLEHIPFPKTALAAAHRLLDTTGILLLSMPNIDSTAWKLSTQFSKNPYWDEIEHCHNFGKDRLYALLEEQGFKPIRYGISNRYRMCMEIICTKSEKPNNKVIKLHRI